MRRTAALALSFLLAVFPLAGLAAHPAAADDPACEHATAADADCCQSADQDAPGHCDCAPGASCLSGPAPGFCAAPSSSCAPCEAVHGGVAPDRGASFCSLVLAVPLRPPVAGV